MKQFVFGILFSCFNILLFSAPAMRISKPIALVDEEISIEFKRLKPFQRVLLHAEAIDAAGEKWSSEALYCADARGRLKLTKTAPLDGSYIGIDSMGLFWSMLPESGPGTIFQMPDEWVVHLDLMIDNQPVISRTITRLKKSPEIRRFSIREKGIVGALYLPPSLKPLPVIVTLSGFLGGLGETKAQLLASHGFAVLALAYFGMEGLPQKLENVPLEYFAKAFEWIKAQPDLDSTKVGLFGVSRGAELALLLGTIYPEYIKAIAAIVPSSVAFSAFENHGNPAWTLNGKPVGSYSPLPSIDLKTVQGKDPKHPLNTTPLVIQEIQKNTALQSAAIPVEKLKCSLLLVSAGDDQIWPSSLFAAEIKERLKNNHSKISIKTYDYPKAGHQIGIPFTPAETLFYHPETKLWFSMGGTTQEDDRASRDSWRKTLVFFQNKLN